MREVIDPFKGMKYSDIITADEDAVKLYREKVPPLRRQAGTGKASWDASIGKYVV